MEEGEIFSLNDIISINKETLSFLTTHKSNNDRVISFYDLILYDEYSDEKIFSFQNTEEDFFYYRNNIIKHVIPIKIWRKQRIMAFIKIKTYSKWVKNLVFIENHYINKKLVAQYHFNIKWLLPFSTNQIIYMYDNHEKEYINEQTYTVKAFSDTFIWVDNELVEHRRAEYTYI